MDDSFLYQIYYMWLSSPYHKLPGAVALKCLLILFYASLLWLLIRAVKKIAGRKMGVRAGYYIWYTLMLAIPLSGLEFNGPPKFQLLKIYATRDLHPLWWPVTIAGALWVLVVLYRVEAHIITNSRLEYAARLMKGADIGEMKNRAAAAFGLRAKWINVVEAEWISSPITYGVFRKTILLPRGFQDIYSEDELYLLLLHEMAHIKNRDMEKLYFISLLSCFFIVPPGFIRDFKRDSEILCDNRVIGIINTDADVYTDLLIQESTRKSAPIKGIAFSDSFRALQSRVKALERFSPVKHRFAVFSAVILVVLLAAFYHASISPDMWYREAYPPHPEFDMFVGFEGEDFDALSLEYQRYATSAPIGVMPLVDDDRPRLAALAGTYEFPQENTIRLNLKAMQDILSGMEKDGAKATTVFVATRQKAFSPTNVSAGCRLIRVFEESADADDGVIDGFLEYSEMSSMINDKYLHKLIAYWL